MIDVHRRWAAGVALAACALFTGGCAAAGSGSSATGSGSSAVLVKDKSNGHTVSLKVGQRLELILASSYWTVRGSSVPGVVRQDGHSIMLKPPPGCAHIPGLGCAPVRTDFSALAPGTSVITAHRSSCGEALRCLPGQQDFAVTIVVR